MLERKSTQEFFDEMALAWFRRGYESFTLRQFTGMAEAEYSAWTSTGVLSDPIIRCVARHWGVD